MTIRRSTLLPGFMNLRRGLCAFAMLTVLVPAAGCDSEEEKAAKAERKAAGEEARRKAGLSIDEHEKACDKDDADSCVALATAYQVGEDREADPAKAQSLFEKACKLGNGPACIDAADPYLDKGELEKARPLVEAGCKAEHDDSCTRLATIDQKLGKAEGGEGGEAAEDGAAKAGDGKEMSEAERLMAEIEAAEKDDG